MQLYCVVFVFMSIVLFANCGDQSKVDVQKNLKTGTKNEKTDTKNEDAKNENVAVEKEQSKSVQNDITVQAPAAIHESEDPGVSLEAVVPPPVSHPDHILAVPTSVAPAPSDVADRNTATGSPNDYKPQWVAPVVTGQGGTIPPPPVPPPGNDVCNSPAANISNPSQPVKTAARAIIKVKMKRRAGIWAYEVLMPKTDTNVHPAADPDDSSEKDSHGNSKYSAFYVEVLEGLPATIKFNVRDESTNESKYTVAFVISSKLESGDGSHDHFIVTRIDLLNDKPINQDASQDVKLFYLAAMHTNQGPRYQCQEHPEWSRTKLSFEGNASLSWPKDAYLIDITYETYLPPTP